MSTKVGLSLGQAVGPIVIISVLEPYFRKPKLCALTLDDNFPLTVLAVVVIGLYSSYVIAFYQTSAREVKRLRKYYSISMTYFLYSPMYFQNRCFAPCCMPTFQRHLLGFRLFEVTETRSGSLKQIDITLIWRTEACSSWSPTRAGSLSGSIL